MKILINEEEVICSNNFTINMEMLNTPSVILNNVYPATWENDKDYVSRFYHPKDYSQCCIYDDDENLLFCGIVKNSGNISLNPRHPHYSTLQILDYKTFLSEGETLDFVIANKTIEEAINQIIDVIAPYGFELGELDINGKDDIIGAYSTKDMTAYDVFNYLTDITQSRWTTRVLGEGQVAIDFYDPSNLPLGTTLNYNETWFKNNDIIDITYNYGSRDYRNKQVMTSNEIVGNVAQTQTIITDGYAKQWETEQAIGQINSASLNGVALTITTNEQKSYGYDADIYYTPGKSNFTTDRTFAVGSVLIIDYTPIVEGRQIITDQTEINRIATATGVKGVISRYENRNDATTSMELQKIGQSYIKYKGTPEIKLTIKTRHNLWNVGDRVPTLNMPITDLATTYMVKKKSINYITTADTIFYTFELTSSFNAETEINYFDNQRAKAKGNIGQGEFITRNIDIESSANIIFFDSDVEEITITGDNELNSILNAPLIK